MASPSCNSNVSKLLRKRNETSLLCKRYKRSSWFIELLTPMDIVRSSIAYTILCRTMRIQSYLLQFVTFLLVLVQKMFQHGTLFIGNILFSKNTGNVPWTTRKVPLWAHSVLTSDSISWFSGAFKCKINRLKHIFYVSIKREIAMFYLWLFGKKSSVFCFVLFLVSLSQRTMQTFVSHDCQWIKPVRI